MTTTFNWSTPTLISNALLNSTDPQLAVDGNGNTIVVWTENGFIRSVTKPPNSGWGTPVTVSLSGASAAKVVVDSTGNATAIWVENSTIKASSKPVSGNWGASTVLSTSPSSSPSLAVDGAGNIVAAWIKNTSLLSSTKLFGANWQNSVVISNNTSALSPTVSIGGSGATARAVVVWYSSASNAVFASNKNISGTWTASQQISDSSNSAGLNVSVIVDAATNATALWYAYNTSGNSYYNVTLQSSSLPSGSSVWTTPTVVSAPGIRIPDKLFAKVVSDNAGNVLAVWSTSFDGSTISVQSALKPLREAWLPAVDITSSIYSYKGDVAVSAYGDALVPYMYLNGSSMFVNLTEANVSGSSDASWAVPVNVSTGNNNGFPRIAVSSNGNNTYATIVYVKYNGATTVIQAVSGLKVTIAPPTALAVTQATNSFGIFTEAYNTLTWTASVSPNIVGYAIYRNGSYVKTVPGTVSQYIDNNVVAGGSVSYGIASVNDQQSQSRIVTVNYP